MAIGKENFMWECSSICLHRWGELASERPTWASHTTTVGQSKYPHNRSADSYYNRRDMCDVYLFFNKPPLFNLYLLTKGQESLLHRISMCLTLLHFSNRSHLIGLLLQGEQEARADGGCVCELDCVSVGNQWNLFNYWMNLISSTDVITSTA